MIGGVVARLNGGKRAVLAAIVAVAAFPAAAHATTISVTTEADAIAGDGHCSLREAITAANTDTASGPAAGECPAGAGADTIDLPAGLYALTIHGTGDDANASGDLDVAGDLTIAGDGATRSVIDASGLDRVLDVHSGTVAVDGVTLRGGRAPDGAAGTRGPNQTIAGAQSDGTTGSPGADGGGIRNQGTLTLTDSVVTGNAAGKGGDGGDGGKGGDGGTFAGDGSSEGGAGGAGGRGGGIFNGGDLMLTRTTVSRNSAGAGGRGGDGGAAGDGAGANGGGTSSGAIGGDGGDGGAVASTGTLEIAGSTIDANTSGPGGAGGAGGAAGNGSQGGNAIGGFGGTGGAGGGVSAGNSPASVTGTTIASNRTGGGGAGGDGGSGGKGLNINPSTGDGTSAGGWGGTAGAGGGFSGGSGTALENVTVTDDATGDGGGGGGAGTGPSVSFPGVGRNGGDGGGVAAASGSVIHGTISGNSTGAGGAAGTDGTNSLGGAPGTAGAGGGVSGATLQNTIVAASTSGGNCASATDGGHNLAFPDDGTCTGFAIGDPVLGPLDDNGGPTKTRRLGTGSAALDAVPAAGSGCAATDQRGVARPQGADCDIGAYEKSPPSVTTDPATDVGTDSGTLNGSVHPELEPTTYHFEYGKTTAYGSSTPDGDAGAGNAPADVSAALTGLDPATTYHYHLVATNADGTATGPDQMFTTRPAPAPSPGPSGGSPVGPPTSPGGPATSSHDDAPPLLRTFVRHRITLHELVFGFRVGGSCNEDCSLRFHELAFQPDGARTAGFNHVLARAALRSGRGARHVTLRPCVRGAHSRAAVRSCRSHLLHALRVVRSLRIEILTIATDRAGNRARRKQSIRVR